MQGCIYSFNLLKNKMNILFDNYVKLRQVISSSEEQPETRVLLPSSGNTHKKSHFNLFTMKESCTWNILSTRKLGVDTFAILFGIGSWISINGMFVQLPLMVQSQPEGWNLPSYLTIIIQLGNIGPILYSLIRQRCFCNIKDSWIIYFLQIVSCISMILMAFLYQETTYIGGNEHSTSLFILVFFLAFVSCTSSVLFMPFMNNFSHIYLISYFVGEGLSGLLPAIVALIQGVGGNPSCVNQTDANGTTSLVPETPDPLFFTRDYFIFIFCMLIISCCAFILLNKLSYCKSEKITLQRKRSDFMEKYENEQKTEEKLDKNDNKNEDGKNVSSLSIKEYIYYLTSVSFLCLFSNGLFPGIMSYSCLPYGNVAYHLSVTLSNVANPLACFLAFFMPFASVKVTSVLGVLSLITAAYNIATSVLSPTPPLQGTAGGEALVVLSWVIFTGLISYIKVSVASVFHVKGGRALFWYGATQQMGSAAGSIISFFLINFTDIFTTYYPCQ